jgi:hypothetical protein
MDESKGEPAEAPEHPSWNALPRGQAPPLTGGGGGGGVTGGGGGTTGGGGGVTGGGVTGGGGGGGGGVTPEATRLSPPTHPSTPEMKLRFHHIYVTPFSAAEVGPPTTVAIAPAA